MLIDLNVEGVNVKGIYLVLSSIALGTLSLSVHVIRVTQSSKLNFKKVV